MLDTLKKLFTSTPVDYEDLMQRKALILDVRSIAEYRSGHIKGSINIPLDELNAHIKKLPKDKPIITCCASGMRSGVAKRTLLNQGFTEVHNGGGWMNLNGKIK